jgi:hypothetical protein
METGNDAGEPPGSPLPAEEGSPPEGSLSGEQPPADFLPWLSENPPGASDSVVTWLESKELEPGELETPDFGQGDLGAEDIPEWLRDMEEGSPEAGVLAAETTPDSLDLPEWLESSPGEGGEGEVPDWLKEMVENPEEPATPSLEEPVKAEEAAPPAEPFEWQPEGVAETAVDSSEEANIQASEPASELPSEWSAESEDTGEPGEVESTPWQGGEAEEEEDAAFAWLAGLAARQGAEEGSISSPDEPQETPPEWVQEVAEVPTEQEAPVEADLPVETLELESTEAVIEEEAGLPDWLQVGPEQEESPVTEELETTGEEPPLAAAELPDWLHGLATGAGEGEGTPAWEENGEASLQPAEPDDLLDWLKESEEPSAVEEEAGLAFEESEDASLQPAEPAELPDWLKESAVPPVAEAEAASGLSSLEEPPVSEGDTKPTRVSKATEVSIPAALAGFVAGASLLQRKRDRYSEETPIGAGARPGSANPEKHRLAKKFSLKRRKKNRWR